jgi:hypothetical protein
MNAKKFLAVTLFATTLAGAALAAEATTTTAGTSTPSTVHVTGAGVNQRAVIEAGTDPSALTLHFPGASKVSNAFPGGLEILNGGGAMWHYRPQVYQIVNGKRREVAATFRVTGKDSVVLVVGKIDKTADLIVSPVGAKNL